jgi:DNA-binding GntR family transcriptional regulator
MATKLLSKASRDDQRERPKMLKDEAYVKIENLIVTGELEPGRWVSETELIKLSGFARASVRSAIQRLSDQDLIIVVPSRGAQIAPIDYTQQFRVLEIRRVIEDFFVRWATKRGSAEHKAEFAELAEGFRSAAANEDLVAMTEFDRRNFALMLKAADNAVAEKSMTSVKGLSRRFWVHFLNDHGTVREMADRHSDVAAGMAGKDEEVASKALQAMIDHVEEFTLSAIGYNPRK